jgi:hypothetical protein
MTKTVLISILVTFIVQKQIHPHAIFVVDQDDLRDRLASALQRFSYILNRESEDAVIALRRFKQRLSEIEQLNNGSELIEHYVKRIRLVLTLDSCRNIDTERRQAIISRLEYYLSCL